MALRARLGIRLPVSGEVSGSADMLGALARAVDDGFDALWVPDAPDDVLTGQGLEAVTFLGALSQATARITIGMLPTIAGVRPPGVLAKQLTTIDVLSGGRAALAVAPPPQPQERAAAGVEETVLACRDTFGAEHNRPHPTEAAGPPILVDASSADSGSTEALLELAARLGDGCVVTEGDASRALPLLRQQTAAFGRRVPALVRLVGAIGDPRDTAARAGAALGMGSDGVVVDVDSVDLDALTELASALRGATGG